MPDISPTLNESKVRKWGTKLLAIADWGGSDAIPADLFGVDHLPVALPAGFKELGLISTDGVVLADSLSTENTDADQSLEPVRTDLTGREQSMTATFLEANAWVNAVSHGKQVADFPADRDGAWDFTDEGISDFPYYLAMMITKDGVGDQTVYRVEAAYKMKVTAKTDRTVSRRTAEQFGFTFGLFRDKTLNKTYRRAEDGPSLHAPATLPVISAVTPSEAAVGEIVKITGTRFTGTTGITIDAVAVTEYSVHSDDTIYAVIPATVSGAADVVVTTAAGASTAYAYTAAA